MILLDVVLSCVNKCAKSCLLYLFEQDDEDVKNNLECSIPFLAVWPVNANTAVTALTSAYVVRLHE